MKNKTDLQVLSKTLDAAMEDLIKVYLTSNFGELYNLSSQFIQTETDGSSKPAGPKINLFTPEKLQDINADDLERIGKDFLKNYKPKIDNIIKDIRTNVQSATLAMTGTTAPVTSASLDESVRTDGTPTKN